MSCKSARENTKLNHGAFLWPLSRPDGVRGVDRMGSMKLPDAVRMNFAGEKLQDRNVLFCAATKFETYYYINSILTI